MLDLLRGLKLVGGVLIKERGLELLLQVAIGTKGKAFGSLALGIEGNEVLGNILDLLLGFLLQHLPGVAAQPVEGGGCTFLAHIATDFVQAVNADIEGIVVLV